MNRSSKDREPQERIEETAQFVKAKSPKAKETVSPIDEETFVEKEFEDDPASKRSPEKRSNIASDDVLSSRQFGDYEIVEEIARGGMGVVYEATHRSLKRTVALKMILRGEFATQGDVERFHLEAKAAAGLDHPGIVPVYEVGELDGKQFFAMAFIEGGSLGDRVKQGPISNREAAEITKRIVEAMVYAHEHGVIHRDLKPSNILIGNDGQPKITDFGLAKKVDDDSGLTHTGQILGTPSYMPPEQAAGDASKVGPTADIYAIGAILYCLLTGKPPFQSAKSIDTILLVLNEEPIRPRLLNPAIDADLETICLRCLEKLPNKRYSSAKALEEELSRYLRGEPIISRPVGAAERILRWSIRHPWISGLLATVVVLLILGTTVSTSFAVLANLNAYESRRNFEKSEIQRQRADANATIAKSEESKAKTLLKQVEAEKKKTQHELDVSQRLLNLNHIRSAAREWKSSHASSAWKHLDAYRGASFEWEHQYLFNLFTRNHQTLAGHQDEVNAIDVSRDERLLVSASGGRWSDHPVCEVKLWNLETQETLFKLSDFHSPVNDVAFHPSGETFALATANGFVRICSVQTGETIVALPSQGGLNAVAFGNNGRLLAMGGMDGVTRVWDALTKETIEMTGDAGGVNAIAFTPDDKFLLTGSEKVATLWDTATGEKVRVFSGHPNAVHCVAFDSSGKRAATGCWDGSIVVWNIESGELIVSLPGHHLAVYAVEFSPDDKQVASASYDQKIIVWDIESRRASHILEGHTGTVYDVQFTRQGRQVVSAAGDGLIKIWDPNLNDHAATFRRHSGYVGAVAYSPNGTRVASSGNYLKIWDPLTGDIQIECEGYAPAAAIAFSPMGDRIAAATWNGEFVVWDAATGKLLLRHSNQDTFSVSIDYSHSGDQIAVGYGNGWVFLFDAQSGEILQKIEHGGEVKGLAYTPDDKAIIVGSTTGLVQSWNVTTGKPMLTFSGQKAAVYAMSLSSDGKLLAIGGPTSDIYLQSTQTGEMIDVLKSRLIQIYTLAIGDNDKRLVVGGADGSLELWDIEGRERTIVLEGHKAPIVSVAFSEDGRQIVSGSRDETAKIWNASRTNSGMARSHDVQPSQVEAARWLEPSDDAFPKSNPSAKHSLIILENHTEKEIHISWSDWDGQRVEWATIEPGGLYRQTTYQSHSWIMTDIAGRDLGCVVVGDLPVAVKLTEVGASLVEFSSRSDSKPSNELSILNQQVEEAPEDSKVYLNRAKWLGARGKWKEAATDLKQVMRLEPENLTAACYLAPLMVFENDLEGYKQHRANMLDGWGQSTSPRECERVAKACLLADDTLPPEKLNSLTEVALSVGPDYEYFQYFLMLKGLNAYRNKHFDAALKACQASRRLSSTHDNPYLDAPNLVIESLSHHALGRREQAIASLRAGEQVFENEFPSIQTGEMSAWPDWLVAKILLDEARAKIIQRNER